MTTEVDGPSLGSIADRIAALGVSCVQLQLGSVVRDIPTIDALLYGLDALGDKIDDDLASYSREVLAARGIEIAAVDGT
ncbi:MAG: hypothetical protein QM650_12975, partial [Microlunatus sp.]